MKQYNVIQQVFPANPRSKKRREMVQGGSSSLVGGFSGAGASVPQYWRLVSTNAEGVPLGEGKEYIEAEKSVHTTGSFVAEGEIVAFATDEAIPDVSFPLASPERLGMVKIGSGLTVTAEGVLSALEGGGGISFTPGAAIRLTDDNVLNVVFGTTNATACAGNDVRLSDACPNPFALMFTGYSTGTYTGADVLSVAIPDNTDQLVNGAGFITGINKPMVLNALTGSGSRSKYLAGDGTFYTVSYAELSGRPDLSVYVTLGSDQTITGLKHFTYGLTAGNKSGVWMQLVSGNVINGMNKTSVGDLYLNYVSQYKSALYYGAAICKKDADTAAYITEANPITGIGGGAVDIPLSGYTTGEYEIYQFLCEKPKTSLSTPAITNAFIPIGDHWVQTVTIKSGTLRVFLQAIWNAGSVTGKIIVTNESNGSETLSRNNILVRYADNLTTTPFEYGKGSVGIPDFTVERQTTVEKNFELKNVLPDFNKRMGAVTFTSNSKSISVRNLIGAEM